jgi:hypothetical protein
MFKIRIKLIFWVSILTVKASLCIGADLSSLLSNFDSMTYTPEGEKSLRVLGQAVQQFIADPKNSTKLNSPEGKELLRRQLKLANYFSIQQAFEKCLKDSDNNLAQRILAGVGKSQILDTSCVSRLMTLPNLQSAITDIKQNLEAPAQNELQQGLFQQSLKNAGVSLLDLKYRYDSKNVTPQSILEVCKDKFGNNQCDQETSNLLLDVGKKYLNDLTHGDVVKFSSQEGAAEVNRRIDGLNQSLAQIKIGSQRGWFSKWIWDRSTPDFNKSTSQEFAGKYVDQYITQASSGPGLLLLTETLRNKVGGLRAMAEDYEKIADPVDGSKFVFTPHAKIGPDDFKAAVEEAKKNLASQSIRLLKMESGRKSGNGNMRGGTNRSLDLIELVRSNPLAVGQFLVQHPEYAGLVCETITKIKNQEQTQAKLDKAWMWGGLIVGGGLALTGVGSAVGAWLLAGTTAGATAVTVGAISTSAGIAVGLTEAGYQTNKAFEARNQQAAFESAFLSGNSDTEAIKEARAALTHFNEAKTQAAISLALSGTDIGSMVGVIKAGQVGAKLAAKSKEFVDSNKILNGASDLLKKVSENPKLIELINNAKASMGGEKVSAFLGYLAQATQATRTKILTKMHGWSNESFKKTVEQALIDASECAQ